MSDSRSPFFNGVIATLWVGDDYTFIFDAVNCLSEFLEDGGIHNYVSFDASLETHAEWQSGAITFHVKLGGKQSVYTLTGDEYARAWSGLAEQLTAMYHESVNLKPSE